MLMKAFNIQRLSQLSSKLNIKSCIRSSFPISRISQRYFSIQRYHFDEKDYQPSQTQISMATH